MSCENLCTAAKCQELESRIEALENLLNFSGIQDLLDEITDLRNSLDYWQNELYNHLNEDLSSAHYWDIYTQGSLTLHPDNLTLDLEIIFYDVDGDDVDRLFIGTQPLPFVKQTDFNEHLSLSIPDAHNYEPNVLVDVFPQDDGSKVIKVQVDESFDEDTFDLDPLLLTIIEQPLTGGQQFDLTVSLGQKISNTGTITVVIDSDTISSALNQIPFFFYIDHSLGDLDYGFELTLGERTRYQVLNLPYTIGSGSGGGGTTEPPPPTSVGVEGAYIPSENELFFSVTVNGKNAATTFDLDEMILELPEDFLVKFDEIHQSFTAPLQGTVEIGETQPPDNDNPQENQYAVVESLSYNQTCFQGINQALVFLEQKLTNIHKDVSLAIDPPFEVPEWTPVDCEVVEEEDENGKIVEEIIDKGLDLAGEYLTNSLFGWLLQKGSKLGGAKAVAVTWVITYLGELIFNQQKETDKKLCLSENNLKKTEECLAEIKKLIEEFEPVAAVPEHWQVRAGADRPQLVVIFGEKDTNSRWSLTIPHYRGGQNGVKSIPSYQKGSFTSTLYLADNSHLTVNAISKSAGAAFISRVRSLIDKDMLEGSHLSLGIERRGQGLKQTTVYPRMAKFFSTGRKDLIPDWTYIYE